MVRNNEGLTKTYNRFHDPEEHDPKFQKLRVLHTDADKVASLANGLPDISTHCEFLLGYEEASNDDEEEGGKRRKKKPYRYRWLDEVRDEVLARLIALNQERAAEERLLGIAPKGRAKGDTDEDESAERGCPCCSYRLGARRSHETRRLQKSRPPIHTPRDASRNPGRRSTRPGMLPEILAVDPHALGCSEIPAAEPHLARRPITTLDRPRVSLLA